MNLHLNASEVGNLWGTYISNTASVCLIKHYLQNVEDEEIKYILNTALHNALKSVLGAQHLFEKANHPIPDGFTDNDVNLNAPRLYSDLFYLLDIWRLSEYGMIFLGFSLSTTLNMEVRNFYTELLNVNTGLINEATALVIKKGISPTPPTIPAPTKVEYVQKINFFLGILGEKRPLNALEIKEIVFNLIGMAHGEALLMGFSQVATSKELRDFLKRGSEICSKHVNVLQMMLQKDDLPTIPTIEDQVMATATPTYSDKLMTFFTISLGQVVLGRYGISLTQCSRSDIIINITRLSAEVANYLKDVMDIMVSNRWLEQPPLASNREAIMEQSN